MRPLYCSQTMVEYYPNNFGGLGEEHSSLESSRFVVLPLPYEATTSYGKGAKLGPRAIIEASRNMELYDEELGCEPCRAGIYTAGDLLFESILPDDMVATVREAAKHFLEQGKTLICLGGEHSLTYPAFEAHRDLHGEIGIVQIDAHADLRDSYEGTPYNHACVMRRICGLTRDIVQVGIRSLSSEEAEFLRAEQDWPIVWARDAARSDGWMDEVIGELPEKVYLTVDLDGFDPSLLSATGTPEPGGLEWYPTLSFLRKLCTSREVVGFDIMELAPAPGNRASDFMAARLTYKLAGYISGLGRQ